MKNFDKYKYPFQKETNKYIFRTLQPDYERPTYNHKTEIKMVLTAKRIGKEQVCYMLMLTKEQLNSANYDVEQVLIDIMERTVEQYGGW